ncbi:chymotrypsin B [Trichonephila clavipes]|nr:chymotrypsin B [Trichonephila clavipes]
MARTDSSMGHLQINKRRPHRTFVIMFLKERGEPFSGLENPLWPQEILLFSQTRVAFPLSPRSPVRGVLHTPVTTKASQGPKKNALNHDFSVAAHFRSLNLQVPHLDKSFQMVPQVFDVIEVRTIYWPGDSGGPLIVKQEGKWYGVGVATWSQYCGVLPSVFTRVTEYLPWIERETRDSPPCIVEPLREKDNQPPVKPNLDNCGIPNEMESERIAGGGETTPFEFPWMEMKFELLLSHGHSSVIHDLGCSVVD